MTREEFSGIAESYLYLDGATGSNLVKAGMPSGVCPERWILEHPEVMLELQRQYAAAGTDILYAPTFTANRVKLAEYGLEGKLRPMVRELVGLSREAAAGAGRPVYVAGDLTMTGELLRPMGGMELETLIDIYKEQIDALAEAGVDLLVVETMMSLGEARAALIAAKELCDLPVMVTMTFEADGRTLYGTDAKTAAVVLGALGASAVGVNCSTGPAQMRPIVEEMAAYTGGIPILAKPNAGLPFLDGEGRTCYRMGAEEFVEEMKVLVEAGASLLGGCCGTTPEYIRALKAAFGDGRVPESGRRKRGLRCLTSERRTVEFGLDGAFLVVGERINPTGKKLLQAQLREGSFEKVLQFAEEQEQCGAQVLDINMGMSGIDEKAMMLRAVEEVGGVTDLPLSLDSSHVDVLEAALRRYPGRALVNSVSLETEKYEKLLPVVKKYGAMFILLPLSDKGLPESLEEKKQIIDKVLERAYSLGMDCEDVVVDGLTATVGANRRAALEVLETIRYSREKGLATICGLSNISFGMPERSFVNAAFLALAIREGLTMAIANPSQELLMGCALASDLLLAKEEADIRYIEFAGKAAEARERREAALQRKLGAAAAQTPGVGQPVSGAAPSGPGIGQDSVGGALPGVPGIGQDSVSGAAPGVPGVGQPVSGAVPGVPGVGQGSVSGAVPGGPGNAGTGRPGAAAGTRGAVGTAANGDTGQTAASVSALADGDGPRAMLYRAVMKGNRNGSAALVRDALAGGEEPSALLNEVLLPAINQVGELFDRGRYFLPQLIASAEAMKNAIEVLEPLLLQESEGEEKPVVVIATVEGDIHDIGKNLVALMLKNYGFRVIDLGKDVPKEEIIRAARENNAQVIALSALMTTTMQRMREVVALARQEGVDAKIMIGGAVITQDYADEIGADGYSADAAEAVKLAKRLTESGPSA